jgi:iron complex transport system substrate-binding protein
MRMAGDIARYLLLLAVCGLVPAAQAEITVTDDAGRQLLLAAPARSIVSLAPHATELLFAAGAGSRVVGVSAFSDYPEVARALPKVSGAFRIDLERLLALKPDLVVGWLSGNARADLDAIQSLGIPVFIAEPRRLEGIAETLERLGHVAGSEETAARAAGQFREGLARLRQQNRDKPPVRVLIQISVQPLMTLSYRHPMHEMVTLCGGRNLFAASDLVAPSLGLEAVRIENPEAVLFSDSLGSRDTVRDWWRERVSLPAVRQGRLYAMPADLVLRQTPRVLQGAERICAALDEARASLARERR